MCRNPQNEHGKRSEFVTVSALFLTLLPIVGAIAYFCSILIAPLMIGHEFEGAFHMIPCVIAGTFSMGFFYHNQAYPLFKVTSLPMSLSSIMCIMGNATFSYYTAIYYGVIGVFAGMIAAFLTAALISASFIVSQYGRRVASA